ncbi:high-affinity nickel transporter [Salmonella enterica subsp. enterica]|uniref:High-affinity nickel transporter n=1 Tax=Salmonella enterica I TaxID=59201 RepID=A0A379WNK9_SALET|nr:high-affinity nickel transporter [Salmonella enterica subsp. enterica]
MSVIFLNALRADAGSRCGHLALFLLLMLVGGLWIWQAWPQVMLKSALWQRDVNQQLSALLNAVATHPERAAGSLLLLSLCMACFMRWGRDTAKW